MLNKFDIISIDYGVFNICYYNFNYFKDNNKNIFVKLIILKFLIKCLNFNLKDIIWVFY